MVRPRSPAGFCSLIASSVVVAAGAIRGLGDDGGVGSGGKEIGGAGEGEGEMQRGRRRKANGRRLLERRVGVAWMTHRLSFAAVGSLKVRKSSFSLAYIHHKPLVVYSFHYKSQELYHYNTVTRLLLTMFRHGP